MSHSWVVYGQPWPSPICPWPLSWSPHFHRQDNALLKLCWSLKPPRSAGAATQTKATKHRWLWRRHPASLGHLKPCFHVLRIASSSRYKLRSSSPRFRLAEKQADKIMAIYPYLHKFSVILPQSSDVSTPYCLWPTPLLSDLGDQPPKLRPLGLLSCPSEPDYVLNR